MEITGVLITGGGGFLGSHLAEYYLRQGKHVICVDDFSTGLRSNRSYLEKIPEASAKLQFIEANVCRPWSLWTDQIQNPAQKISHVFHFASPASPLHYQRLALETMWVNTIGLQEAMLFADAHKARVVFASTSEIYGDPAVSPQSESYHGNVNTQGPRACYDEAKRFGEALLFTHNQKYQTAHGLVRIFNTYGPRMNPADGRVIINFLVQALRRDKLSIYGNGKQTRSFCYVEDLIAGIDAYATSDLQEPINIGNEEEYSILQLAKAVCEIASENPIDFEYFELPKDDPEQRRPDLTKAKNLLAPWKPQIHLEDGLKKMLAWLRTQDLGSFENAGRPQ